MSPIYKEGGIDKVGQEYSGNLIRGILRWLAQRLDDIESGATTIGGAGSTTVTSTVPDALTIEFHANGPYLVGTAKDGAFIVPPGFTGSITSVWLHRTTAGASSSTIVDLNKGGVSMYTTQANRPTIAFNDADNKVQATLPDVLGMTSGDIITMDIDQRETGRPVDLTLLVYVS